MPRFLTLLWNAYTLLTFGAGLVFPLRAFESEREMYGRSVHTFPASCVFTGTRMSFLLHFDFSHGVGCSWMCVDAMIKAISNLWQRESLTGESRLRRVERVIYSCDWVVVLRGCTIYE